MTKKLTPEEHAKNLSFSMFLIDNFEEEFQKLLNAQNEDNGINPAGWHADVWENVEDWTVDEVVKIINETKDNLLMFLNTHK